jgi:hypothetical protein
MQHAHVKRKEKTMNRYIMEEFHNDPALRRRLFSEARRERSRSVNAGFRWLIEQVKARFTPRTRSPNWIARLG